MQQTKLTIIIPLHNEESFISNTLQTLIDQKSLEGDPLPENSFRVVAVINGSTDNTLELVKSCFNRFPKLNGLIINKPDKGIVQARITGYNFVIDNPELKSDILASLDGDVILHPNWVDTVISEFDKEKFGILSNAGCFPLEFWKKVPNLVNKYLEEIGTIFFNKETIDWLGIKGKSYWFTEQIFFDFIRMATDQCLAISREIYESVGGYTVEYVDNEKKIEATGEGGRLSAKVERTNAKMLYCNKAPYTASPRRVLGDVERFLVGNLYTTGSMEQNFRKHTGDKYELLNQMALETDYTGIRKYIIKNYIFTKCITRPNLISKYPKYFGKFKDELISQIDEWWKDNTIVTGQEVMLFAKVLTDSYYDRLMADFPKQTVQ